MVNRENVHLVQAHQTVDDPIRAVDVVDEVLHVWPPGRYDRASMATTKVRISLDEERRDRLARECVKLDREFEVAMAEEGLSAESGDRPGQPANG